MDRPDGHDWLREAAEQAARLLAVTPYDAHGTVVEFALATGMRPSEYPALRWGDLDLEPQVAHVRVVRSLHYRNKRDYSFQDVKTPRARRTIPLPPSLVPALQAHRQDQLAGRPG